MPPTDTGSCEWLATEIDLSHLVERPTLDPVMAEFQADNPYADATALAEHLVKLGLLTTFQATRLLEGQGRGLVLGPYILADALGSGSMGIVYKAIGKADHKPYAVKVLPVRGPWNVRQARKKLQQFPEEAHPAVVPWLDVGTSAGLHYLVWPFAEGESLEETVRRDGLLPPARAASIGVQLAQALQWCERHGVWHGAIKPSNVMLAPDGQVKLLDFGVGVLLAGAEEESLVDTLAESNVLSGLVDCTAPECVLDPGKRSVHGDQYSIGCTLYYGLTGRYPFPDGTTSERMLAHQRQDVTPVAVLNPGVPNALAAAIDRLLQKAPEARYNHTAELIAALSPLARQSTIYHPPQEPPFLESRPTTMPSARASGSLLAVGSARLAAGTPAPSARTPIRTQRPSVADLISATRPAASPPAAVAAPPPAAPERRNPPPPKPTPDALPATPPPWVSPWNRLRRAIMFWKSWADPVACTLLTPSALVPGETTTVQVVLHHTNRAEQARTLPDWRGTVFLPTPLGHGEAVGLNLSLKDVDVPRPLSHIDWNGFSAAALFTVRVPADWTTGQPVQGTLTVGRNQQPDGKVEFALPVATPQPAM
jgi:serine/threonine protein kinase